MRYLENSYDKTKLKIDEATHLRRIYDDIKKKLEVVSDQYKNVSQQNLQLKSSFYA